MTGACRILDLDFDGDYDSDDGTLFDSLDQGLARHPGLLATALDFPFAHQGLYFDGELGSYQNRHRQYDPKLRRFMQRDPLGLRPHGGSGYQDGLGVYFPVRGNPVDGRDPLGEAGTTYRGCYNCTRVFAGAQKVWWRVHLWRVQHHVHSDGVLHQ